MKFFQNCPQPLAAFLLAAVVFPAQGLSQAESSDLLPDGTKSDGCTLIGGEAFRTCCVSHDRDYFFGGTSQERRESDKRLFKCVARKKSFGAKLAAPFVWIGVRIGGLPFLPTPFRWGFGRTKKIEKQKSGERDKPNDREKTLEEHQLP